MSSPENNSRIAAARGERTGRKRTAFAAGLLLLVSVLGGVVAAATLRNDNPASAQAAIREADTKVVQSPIRGLGAEHPGYVTDQVLADSKNEVQEHFATLTPDERDQAKSQAPLLEGDAPIRFDDLIGPLFDTFACSEKSGTPIDSIRLAPDGMTISYSVGAQGKDELAAFDACYFAHARFIDEAYQVTLHNRRADSEAAFSTCIEERGVKVEAGDRMHILREKAGAEAQHCTSSMRQQATPSLATTASVLAEDGGSSLGRLGGSREALAAYEQSLVGDKIDCGSLHRASESARTVDDPRAQILAELVDTEISNAGC